jgi:four helix bundle protein
MKDENLKPQDLKTRTKEFDLRIIKVYSALPKSIEAQVIGKQLLRSGTSVGAHYREAIRSRSSAEFISKIEGGLQEMEETLYWLELLSDSKIIPGEKLIQISGEGNELIAIFVTCVKNARKKEPLN